MTEPKQFKRGRRTYTRMGSFREVKIEGAPAHEAPAVEPMDIDPAAETPAYCNRTTVYQSPDEIVVDFGFAAATNPRGRVRSRVVVSHQHARELAKLLKKAADAS